ncbi:uncharacterized protein TNCV_3946081 [Trichonephila clavipes]|nr:uncharacterized protein TNCV_3946081 [Trichonephila clavipes]
MGDKLKKLMNEIQVVTFERMYEDFVQEYTKNEESKNFVEYFVKSYGGRKQKWVYCYRVGCEINTNMKLERWHRELKYEEGGGKALRRLDKSLSLVLRTISKKLMGRMISMERGKLTAKISTNRMRHETSCKEMQAYTAEELQPTKWIIYKTVANGINTYEVNKVKDCDCPIRCHKCQICIHPLTYEDSNRLRREKEKEAILKEKEKSVVHEEPTELVYEQVKINMQLLNNAINIANAEKIKRIDQDVKNLLQFMDISPFCSSLPSIQHFPANKNIVQQRVQQKSRYFKKQKLANDT